MDQFPRLSAEIRKRGIKKHAIAQSIGVCDKAFRDRLGGIIQFRWAEVRKIQQQFFPDIDVATLFQEAGENVQPESA